MSMPRNPAELLVPGRPLTLAGVADGAEGLVIADLARAVAARADPPATSLVAVCRDGPRMERRGGPGVVPYRSRPARSRKAEEPSG